ALGGPHAARGHRRDAAVALPARHGGSRRARLGAVPPASVERGGGWLRAALARGRTGHARHVPVARRRAHARGPSPAGAPLRRHARLARRIRRRRARDPPRVRRPRWLAGPRAGGAALAAHRDVALERLAAGAAVGLAVPPGRVTRLSTRPGFPGGDTIPAIGRPLP